MTWWHGYLWMRGVVEPWHRYLCMRERESYLDHDMDIYKYKRESQLNQDMDIYQLELLEP